MQQRAVLTTVGAVYDAVYFMESGVASVLTVMADGDTVEVGMIGNEGIIGLSALFGGKTSIQHIVIQIPGSAYRVDFTVAKAAFDRSEKFRNLD